jgi:GAF domain-containing protein
MSLPPITEPPAAENSSFFDWRPTLTMLRETDWEGASVGPMEHWPEELRSAMRSVLPSRMPMLLWWGADLVQLYNEACIPLLGHKHPVALGRPAAQSWAEAWEEIGPLAAGVLLGQGATYAQDRLLLLDRRGYLEESYWTFSFSPVLDEAGRVRGVLVALQETTSVVVGNRRLQTLHELGGISTAEAKTASDVCRATVQILERNRADVPAALAFLAGPDRKELEMCQASGLHPATEKAWSTVSPPESALPLWAVHETRGNQRVPISGSALEGAFLPDPVSGAVPTEAMVLPLVEPDGGAPIGTLVLGFSACRPPDDDVAFFFDLVARQVSTALSDARAYQSARERTANLEIALASNRQIGVAIGILMHQHRITEAAAFDRLRTTSQDLNRKLRDVAEEVTLTGRLPESRSARA